MNAFWATLLSKRILKNWRAWSVKQIENRIRGLNSASESCLSLASSDYERVPANRPTTKQESLLRF